MNKITIWIFSILVFVCPILVAQDFNSTTEEETYDMKRQAGLGFAMAETGSSLGLFISWPLIRDFHFGLGFDVFMLRDSKQIDWYDPIYGYPYSINKKNNVYLFTLMTTAKKRLFRESLADELRPFISAGLGPVYGMNFPESDASTLPRKDEYRWTIGGFVGGGVDFGVKSNNLVSVRVQYRIIPFTEQLGERRNHSMLEIRFEIVQRF